MDLLNKYLFFFKAFIVTIYLTPIFKSGMPDSQRFYFIMKANFKHGLSRADFCSKDNEGNCKFLLIVTQIKEGFVVNRTCRSINLVSRN